MKMRTMPFVYLYLTKFITIIANFTWNVFNSIFIYIKMLQCNNWCLSRHKFDFFKVKIEKPVYFEGAQQILDLD